METATAAEPKPKKMHGFARYQFYPDGRVQNIATGNFIKPFNSEKGWFGVILTTDTGKRKQVTLPEIMDLFAEEKPAAPAYVLVKKAKYTYRDAVEIRRIINTSQTKSWTEWGKQFGVHRSNIERIMNEKAHPTKPEHIAYSKGLTDQIEGE